MKWLDRLREHELEKERIRAAARQAELAEWIRIGMAVATGVAVGIETFRGMAEKKP